MVTSCVPTVVRMIAFEPESNGLFPAIVSGITQNNRTITYIASSVETVTATCRVSTSFSVFVFLPREFSSQKNKQAVGVNKKTAKK
jgi:hypothetical protein